MDHEMKNMLAPSRAIIIAFLTYYFWRLPLCLCANI
jgi:hypothetical protein